MDLRALSAARVGVGLRSPVVRARLPGARAWAVLGAAARTLGAATVGSPDDALFAPLRSAGTAATARDARQQRKGRLWGRGGVQ